MWLPTKAIVLRTYLFCKQSLDFHRNLLDKNILDDGFEQNIEHLFHSCMDYGIADLDMLHWTDSRRLQYNPVARIQ